MFLPENIEKKGVKLLESSWKPIIKVPNVCQFVYRRQTGANVTNILLNSEIITYYYVRHFIL